MAVMRSRERDINIVMKNIIIVIVVMTKFVVIVAVVMAGNLAHVK